MDNVPDRFPKNTKAQSVGENLPISSHPDFGVDEQGNAAWPATAQAIRVHTGAGGKLHFSDHRRLNASFQLQAEGG